MRIRTWALRGLLVALLVGLVLASGLLYIVSLDLADTYPEVAHLRIPIFLAVLIGLVPVPVAVRLIFAFLGLVDRDEAFSRQTVRLLRQLKLLFAITAGSLTAGFVGVSVAVLPLQSPSIPLAWLAAEVVLLFFFTLIALLERLFSDALELRLDHELTV